MFTEDFDALHAANQELCGANYKTRPLVKGEYTVEVPLREGGAWRLGWLRVPQYKQNDEWRDISQYNDTTDRTTIYSFAADLIYEQLRSIGSWFGVLDKLKHDLCQPTPCRMKNDPDTTLVCFTWGLDCADYVKRPLIIPGGLLIEGADLDDAEVGYIQFARNPCRLLQSVLLPPDKPLKGQKYHSWIWNDLLLPWATLVGSAYVDHTLKQMSEGIEPIFSDGVATLETQSNGNCKWRIVSNSERN